MQYISLGRTGLQVSRLCLGTMNFGPQTSEADSFAIMDQALEQGINFFDTANRYGATLGMGQTEQIIGRWLAQGGRRERIVLATKLYGAMGSGPNDRGLSAYHIRRACEDSLSRLQTDHIDLYQMHHIERRTPWEEIWQAMEQLVREGKVLYIGSSNFAGWDIATAQGAAAARHGMGLVSEQWDSSPGAHWRVDCWAARSRRPRPGAGRANMPRRTSKSIAPSSRPTRRCVRSLVKSLPTSHWPGCCTTRSSPPPSLGHAPWSS